MDLNWLHEQFCHKSWCTKFKDNYDVFSASQQTAQSSQHKTKQQLELEKAKFLMNQAIDDDSAGNIEDAVAQYSEAVELCLKLVSLSWKQWIKI